MKPFIRAWNISGQQWEYFTLKELACGGVYNFPVDMPAICKWDNYKWWCLFTGIRDKNGKEIYEGDKDKDKGVVVWSKKFAGFVLMFKDEKGKIIDDDISLQDTEIWFEICGNVHEGAGGKDSCTD